MSRRKTKQHDIDLLLMEYAIGALSEAQTMIMASYLYVSPNACASVRHFETVGGTLIEEHCTPVAMMENSLENVLERLHEELEEPAPPKATGNLPAPLCCYLAEEQPHELPWKEIYPGMETFSISFECCPERGHLLRMAPGVRAPRHYHEGMEITLVLEGGFRDKNNIYHSGDIVIMHEGSYHAPIADKEEGCLFLTITEGSIRPTGLLDVLNSFFRR